MSDTPNPANPPADPIADPASSLTTVKKTTRSQGPTEREKELELTLAQKDDQLSKLQLQLTDYETKHQKFLKVPAAKSLWDEFCDFLEGKD